MKSFFQALPRDVQMGLGALGGWTLMGLVSISISLANFSGEPLQSAWSTVIWPTLISAWGWAAVTPFIFRVSRRLWVSAGNWIQILLLHLLLALAVALIYALIIEHLFPILLGIPQTGVLERLNRTLLLSILAYGGLVAAAYAVEYYRLFRAQLLRSARLEGMLAEAQGQVLRSHLHPHFLFNTLNAATELVHHDPELADEVLTRLTHLLRRVFSESAALEVPLERELAFAEEYLEIAKIRFGSRLRTRIDVADEARKALVPSFFLQPLLENALRHGVQLVSGGVTVEVHGEVEGENLRIRVVDTGAGLPAEPSEVPWGTGLEKVNGLLKGTHPDAPGLALEHGSPAGAVSVVTIPFLPSEDVPEPDARNGRVGPVPASLHSPQEH